MASKNQKRITVRKRLITKLNTYLNNKEKLDALKQEIENLDNKITLEEQGKMIRKARTKRK